MSSLAATQADGYYLPPEYYEAAQKNPKLTKNQWYHNQQQGNSSTSTHRTVRFELPYNALCQNCDAYISRGTRYNAVKRRPSDATIDNKTASSSTTSYITDDTWEFHMNCRVCHTQEFIIRTDPLHQQFVFVQGLQKLQRNESHRDRAVHEESAEDPVQAIERRQLLQHEQAQLPLLQKQRNEQFLNDADRNAQLRDIHRAKRQRHNLQTQLSQKNGWNPHRTRLLTSSSRVDQVRAKETTYGTSALQKQKHQWKKLRQGSIFVSRKTNRTESSSSSAPCPDVISSIESHSIKVELQFEVQGSNAPHPRERRQIQAFERQPTPRLLDSSLVDYNSDTS
ncbi:coiled-coil domain-containing protein 130 [Fistulifera solaris]|jgi:coiled-coil domain-containing protein 130|uniref:Coiled-coil domain-containing protein 130 n=1 Tax=Fistulifera solaris TaxID=1519565 RepID=A0A1Z5K844_FISSO|nr:coiled-coil domain-containing protein 130 [Fistulifera solaris]|eukprot:GAX22376.1 coiled-coil domain-containing protein 130 [Fistulifera solaris]